MRGFYARLKNKFVEGCGGKTLTCSAQTRSRKLTPNEREDPPYDLSENQGKVPTN